MKRLICIILIICMVGAPSTALAGVRIISDPDDIFNSIYVFDYDERWTMSFIYGTKIKENEDYPMPRIIRNGEQLKGRFTYPNYDSSKLGPFDLQWVFTPADKTIEPISGTVKAIIAMRTSGTMRDEDDDVSAPEFKATTLSMQVGTSCYPQIDNNVGGSDYLWKTSDKTVVSVNKKTGRITAKGSGTATITCKMDTPYDETFMISMEITVVTSKRSNMNITLSEGDVYTLPSAYDASEYTVTYASSKNSIVNVDHYTGEITARSEGEAYITRTITDKEYNIILERFKISVTE